MNIWRAWHRVYEFEEWTTHALGVQDEIANLDYISRYRRRKPKQTCVTQLQKWNSLSIEK